MKVLLRVDASTDIGIGHVMRCMTLADALEAQGAQCHFVCREHSGNLIKQISDRGHHVYPLPLCETNHSAGDAQSNPSQALHAQWLGCHWLTDARQTINAIGHRFFDWLVVDHYALDHRWEKKMRSACNKIMVIDDLADRRHHCDLLLDQNYYENLKGRYKGLVPSECKTLLGPKYALLKEEFRRCRNEIGIVNQKIKKILIFFGGVDRSNETAKAIEALEEMAGKAVECDIVVGGSNPQRSAIKEMCAQRPGFTYHCQVTNMADLMVAADLFIGAGGTTTLERMCLGLPGIVVTVADNQEQPVQALASQGYLTYAGKSDEVTKQKLREILCGLESERLVKMRIKCMHLVDGMGTQRVLKSISSIK
jgi:UDP-2,4-diacetamido-2,4,6-trideoxy-beta-L-altropyranose hydrolase